MGCRFFMSPVWNDILFDLLLGANLVAFLSEYDYTFRVESDWINRIFALLLGTGQVMSCHVM